VRAHNRRRPALRSRSEAPAGVDLSELAQAARYIGSPEHKDFPSPAGPPSMRSDATKCPHDRTFDEISGWLREAITAGDVGGPWTGHLFPQLVWRRVGDVVFEARLSNNELGWYHGYPNDRTEWPTWLR
jgi:hypothetical protein